jgi:CRP-like cAMP-binding protein
MRKALHIMGILNDTDVEWLVDHGTKQLVPAGTILIRQGEPIEFLTIILEGECAIRLGRVDGPQVATLLTGEILGEISFADSRPPSAFVIASSTTLVLQISRDLLREKLADDDAFGSRFYRALATFLADRLRTTTSRFGYGQHKEDMDPDELDDPSMENIAVAASRFDSVLRRLRVN